MRMPENLYLSANLAKKYAKLKQKKYREEFGLFLAEGVKVCEELLKSDYEVEALLIDESKKESSVAASNCRKLIAKSDVFYKIADSKSPQNIMAVVKYKEAKIDLDVARFVAIENVQDPGNLGTILRTAAWFGVQNVLLSSDSVDVYSPKVIRSTMGNMFAMNVIYCDDLVGFARRTFPRHKFFGAELHAQKRIEEIEVPENFGLFFGNEANGLRRATIASMDENYLIGGSGDVESLNLSVSAGIALYRFCGK